MVRYLGWVVNTALFVLCCFLVADTANAIIAAWLTGPPAVASDLAQSPAAPRSSWERRQVIVQRNLFHSSSLAPKPVEPEEIPDELEETKLPLKLWGTIASADPAIAHASVEDLDAKIISAVRVGDSIKSAEIVGIERKRVVLLENGVRRALTLDDDMPAAGPGFSALQNASASRVRGRAPSRPSRSRRSARAERRNRLAKIAEKRAAEAERVELEASDIEEAVNNPATLYTQARILPKVSDDGLVSGIEISEIKAGSVFEEVGINDGDVITEIGGVPINDVGEGGQVLSALTQQEEVVITVEGADGTVSTKVLQMPQ